ncbi:MAG: hypothetical protein H7263_05130 [Candidatus Sericytochromatia bacterium]|nr:hypothetical protein [Candidatus Sericytochromatia bacterium]
MITNLPVRVLDGKLTKIDEMELRIRNLEAVLIDLRMDLSEMRHEVQEEDLKKIEKLNKYQKTIDQLWKQQSAV